MTKSKKNVHVSLTKIRNLLKEAVFNPQTMGPMKIVSEQGSPEYYELRAIEEIYAARDIRIRIAPGPGPFANHFSYDAHIIKAIQLLLLARCHGTTET